MSTQHNLGSRRQFVKTVGGTAVVGTLAGCLGGDGGSGDSITLTHIGTGGDAQKIREEKMREFGETRDEDVTIQGEVFTTNIEMLNVVNENPSAYDLLSALSINGVVLHELQYNEELLAEIDYDRIPNYTENIQEDWRSGETNPLMKNNPYGVQNYISGLGFAYNTEALDSRPTTWDDMIREEFQGEIALFDGGIPRYVHSAAAIGASPSEGLQDDELYQEIWDEARRQNELVETYWETQDEQIRLYREGSAVIGEAFGSPVRILQDDGLPFKFWVPEAGMYPGQGAWAIVKESDNKDFIYDFLNWVYQRENIIELFEGGTGPMPITDPPEQIRQDPEYVAVDAFLDIDIRSIIPAAQRLSQTWAEVKA